MVNSQTENFPIGIKTNYVQTNPKQLKKIQKTNKSKTGNKILRRVRIYMFQESFHALICSFANNIPFTQIIIEITKVSDF